MDPKNLKDMAGRLQRGGKGAGIGVGLLGAAAGLAYGMYQSLYTGKFMDNLAGQVETWRRVSVTKHVGQI